MSKLKVAAFGLSIDGYGAGPDQSLAQPMGVGGMALHEWVLHTRHFKAMHLGVGDDGTGDTTEGSTGIDNDFARRAFDHLGAWILGRNMFGPVRGPWPDDAWKGWWGDEPPYHVPVFVLTHHAREPLVMAGGTTFHFVTGGIHEALDRARAVAGGLDVRIGGGVATVRQYLQAGLIDEMHLVLSSAVLGRGEPLLAGIDLNRLGLRVTERVPSEHALHVVLQKA